MKPEDDNLRGSVKFNVPDEELIEPLDIDWDAAGEKRPTRYNSYFSAQDSQINRSEEPDGHDG